MAFLTVLALLVLVFITLGLSDRSGARALRIVLGVVLVTILLAGAAIVGVVVLALTSSKDVPDLTFDDAEMTAARRQAEQSMDERFAGLQRRAPQLHEVGEGQFDDCIEGTSDWKTQDDHAWECHLTDVRVYAFAGTFADQALAITDALPEQPCPPGEGTNAGAHLEDVGPLTVIDAIAGGSGTCGRYGTYGGADLSVEGWIVLPLDPNHDRINRGKVPGPCAGYEAETCRNRTIDLDEVAAKARPEDTHLVVVSTTERAYWQADWR